MVYLVCKLLFFLCGAVCGAQGMLSFWFQSLTLRSLSFLSISIKNFSIIMQNMKSTLLWLKAECCLMVLCIFPSTPRGAAEMMENERLSLTEINDPQLWNTEVNHTDRHRQSEKEEEEDKERARLSENFSVTLFVVQFFSGNRFMLNFYCYLSLNNIHIMH